MSAPFSGLNSKPVRNPGAFNLLLTGLMLGLLFALGDMFLKHVSAPLLSFVVLQLNTIHCGRLPLPRDRGDM